VGGVMTEKCRAAGTGVEEPVVPQGCCVVQSGAFDLGLRGLMAEVRGGVRQV
jgi:hypothetical protein